MWTEKGERVPEKTMSVHKGEGVLEAGPRGQNFSHTTALNAVLLREFGIFILFTYIMNFCFKYATTYDIKFH